MVACCGQQGLIKGDWLKPGCVVIDCGIHGIPGVCLLQLLTHLLCSTYLILMNQIENLELYSCSR